MYDTLGAAQHNIHTQNDYNFNHPMKKKKEDKNTKYRNKHFDNDIDNKLIINSKNMINAL